MTSHQLVKRACEFALERDKQQHFAVCFVLTVMLLAISVGPELTVLIVTAIGLGKELWDQQYGSGFCWYDMIANGIGTATGLIILLRLNF